MSEEKKMTECNRCGGSGKIFPEFDSLDELIKFVLENSERKWHPGWFYNEAGDQIELYLEEAAHYGEYNEHGFSVLRAFDNKRIIGFVIHGVINRLTYEQRSKRNVSPNASQG